MISPALEHFITQCLDRSRALRDPADCVLEERSYVRLSPDRGANSEIDLVRGGVILLGRGAVSLHLYGRTMNSFHMYDVDARTRKRIDVAHNHI